MKILILILCFSFLSNAASLTCRDSWTRHGGSCYLFTSAAVSWASAKVFCESFDAHMVAIESAEEQRFIATHLTDMHNTEWHWIGGYDIEEEETYIWDYNKQKVVYTNWDVGNGQPDGRQNPKDDCLCLPPSNVWHDCYCDGSRLFICEKSQEAQKIILG